MSDLISRRRALVTIAGLSAAPAIATAGPAHAVGAVGADDATGEEHDDDDENDGDENDDRDRIPAGYADVDPRTARRVPLWHELNRSNPVFPGDPEFRFRIVATVPVEGFLVEQITSLGTHSGTHISAPAHFIEGAELLSELDESWTLMPLAVIDVSRRVRNTGGDFSLGVAALQRWERDHGRIPRRGCVLLFTGFSSRYRPDVGPGPADDYFDPAPGFTGDAAAWLFDERGIRALGSDTFGPDASSDADFAATATALAKGGITVENVGPGLARMRPHGDWVSINGGRPRFSGFQVGITGFSAR